MSGKQIAYAGFGEDIVRVRRVRFQLMAQSVDIDLEDMVLASILLSPHMGEQHILGHDSSGILRQIGEDAVLDGREYDLSTCHAHQMLGIVNRQFSKISNCTHANRLSI